VVSRAIKYMYHSKSKLFISRSCPILVLTSVLRCVARVIVTLMLKTVLKVIRDNNFLRKCDSKIPKFPPCVCFLNVSVIMT
jgi:hypothetical protein